MRPFKKPIFIVSTILTLIISFSFLVYAQDYPAGFYSHISLNHFVEIAEQKRKMEVDSLSLSLGFISPQLLELYFSLGDEDLIYRDENGEKKDFNAALSFQLGTRVFIFKDIQIGVPVDFSFSFEFTQAINEEDNTKVDYKHKRMLGTGDIKWHYSRSEPYMSLGILQARLDQPKGEDDVKEESLFFIAGLKFLITPQIFILSEINYGEDIGYKMGLRYHL